MLTAKKAARIIEYLGLQTDGQPVEITRLNKLLFFAQGHSLAELGHALFENQVDAWDHGPVVPVVFSGYDKIVEKANKTGIEDIQATPEEMDLIMDVWDRYRGYNAKRLVDMTHEEGTPWSDIYMPGVKNAHIPVELMKKYFSRPENRLHRFSANEENLLAVRALPAEEYDPDEDAIWEGLLNDAP